MDIAEKEYLEKWMGVFVENDKEREVSITIDNDLQLGEYHGAIEDVLFSAAADYTEPRFHSLEVDGNKVTLRFFGAQMPAEMPNPIHMASRYKGLKQLEADIAKGMIEAMAVA